MISRWQFRTRLGLAMLALCDWMRGQRSLQVIYRLIPKQLRARLSSELLRNALKGAHFEPVHATSCSYAERKVFAPASANWLPTSGVNIFGYLRAQFGLGESARAYAQALIAAGYPVSLIDIDIDLPHGLGDASLDGSIGEDAPHYINLIFVNPDHLLQAFESIGQARLAGHYTIACWFWELEKVPEDWLWALDLVDEILVASSFVEEAFRRVTNKPILRVSLPVSVAVDCGLTRQDFGIGTKDFVFLVTFDFHSSIHRKNPFAVVEAFVRAFPAGREGVRLLIKSSNGHQHPQQLRQLLSIALNDPRIIVRDQVLRREHMNALQRCADAYVSLHRAEGFGLGLAECMAMGKAVIGTRWSGNLDFMTQDNSCLVGFDMVPVKPGQYPHGDGARWAEADIDEAAYFMGRLVSDPDFTTSLGQKAAADIGRVLSPNLAAHVLIERFEFLAGLPEKNCTRADFSPNPDAR